MRISVLAIIIFSTVTTRAAERVFDFNLLEKGSLPIGWKQAVTGGGPPAKWEILNDDIPSELAPLSATAPVTTIRPVVAQTSTDKTNERFPLLYFDEEIFGDFTLRTKLKMAGGETEQMAGIAFRIVDENNYHVVRASAKGDSFVFYSFINGQRQPPVGNQVDIPANEWLTVEVEARGTQFKFKLNGKEIIPPLTNPNFRKGKIGYWTKSDSISHFVDTRIEYKPLIPQAQRLITSAVERYERLVGLRILIPDESGSTKILASTDESEIGNAGFKEERLVIDTAQMMYLKGKSDVTVSLPLRDRNGDPVAAVRVTMDSFRGQTQKNAIARAQPVVSLLQSNILDYQDLFE